VKKAGINTISSKSINTPSLFKSVGSKIVIKAPNKKARKKIIIELNSNPITENPNIHIKNMYQ